MTDYIAQTNRPDYDRKKLRRLVAALFDEAITDEERGELEAILLSHDAARAWYLEELCVHAWLEWDVPAHDAVAAFVGYGGETGVIHARAGSGATPKRLPIALRYGGFALLAIGAALLLSVAPWLLFSVGRSPHQGMIATAADGAPRSPSTGVAPAIASVSSSSADCRWMFERQATYERSGNARPNDIRSGDTLRVTSGKLRITFARGTFVNLEAPAILNIDSPMRSRLVRGRATVNVAPGDEGFTIDTPRTSVIDLGTDFGVEVDDFGSTDVVVFSGMVDVAISSFLSGSTDAVVSTQRLHAGDGMRVSGQGTASRIVSLSSVRFPRSGPDSGAAPMRKPLITSVRDNINRKDAWQFYEIVPEGMREDAKAFVDREHHEWNGATEAGIPDYLLGGDYIKTFNNDKDVGRFEVDVTLDRPAMVYVLWCKRITPPGWLESQFENTGDEIGVDEGDHLFPTGRFCDRGEPAVGPGLSIDSLHTIWRRRVTSPGVVRLGATLSKGGDLNMYGIVATPLDP